MPTQTILAAERRSSNSELLTHHLEREGFKVIGAPDGTSPISDSSSHYLPPQPYRTAMRAAVAHDFLAGDEPRR